MCEFCENIKTLEEAKYLEDEFELDSSCLVKTSDSKFGIYEVYGDKYYSQIGIYVNYCPKCGRKIVDELEDL